MESLHEESNMTAKIENNNAILFPLPQYPFHIHFIYIMKLHGISVVIKLLLYFNENGTKILISLSINKKKNVFF